MPLARTTQTLAHANVAATHRGGAVVFPLAQSLDDASPTGKAPDAVQQFLDSLSELGLPAWLSIGRQLMADRTVVRQEARADVEAVVGAHGWALAAWHVRDAVATAAFLVGRQIPRRPGRERRQLAVAFGAAEAAALALLTRDHLPEATLRILCAPFAGATSE